MSLASWAGSPRRFGGLGIRALPFPNNRAVSIAKFGAIDLVRKLFYLMRKVALRKTQSRNSIRGVEAYDARALRPSGKDSPHVDHQSELRHAPMISARAPPALYAVSGCCGSGHKIALR